MFAEKIFLEKKKQKIQFVSNALVKKTEKELKKDMLKKIINRYNQQVKNEWLYIVMIAFVFSLGMNCRPDNSSVGEVILILLVPYIADKAYKWRKKQDEKFCKKIYDKKIKKIDLDNN